MESIENHISKDLADLEKAKKDGDTGKQAPVSYTHLRAHET